MIGNFEEGELHGHYIIIDLQNERFGVFCDRKTRPGDSETYQIGKRISIDGTVESGVFKDNTLL